MESDLRKLDEEIPMLFTLRELAILVMALRELPTKTDETRLLSGRIDSTIEQKVSRA